MTYKIDGNLLQKGIREMVKLTVNNLESAIEKGSKSEIDAAVGFCYNAREVAILTLVNHSEIDFYLSEHSKELRQRFGVEIK